jgi:hypothetical protein
MPGRRKWLKKCRSITSSRIVANTKKNDDIKLNSAYKKKKKQPVRGEGGNNTLITIRTTTPTTNTNNNNNENDKKNQFSTILWEKIDFHQVKRKKGNRESPIRV